MRALQFRQRGECGGVLHRRVEAMQQHGVVAREELALVLEHDDAMARDLGIGGVKVDRVHLARGKRLVGDAVVDAARRRLRQGVSGLQSRPAVAAAEEFVRETESQVGMAREVGDRFDVALFRDILRDPDRVTVGKAERDARGEAKRREPCIQRGKIEVLLGLQDLARDRAGVLRVNVDCAGGERFLEDRGVAEALSKFGARATALRLLCEEFAEHIGFGEALGADLQRRFVSGAGEPGGK